MKIIIRFNAFCLACFTSITAASQSLPDYWTTLKRGQFTVGFKSVCLFDTSRAYDLACGDTTVRLKTKKIGRPILVNIWYPAKPANDTVVLRIKDYFNFPTGVNTALFFNKLKAYQFENAKRYSIDGNMSEKNFAGDSSLREKAIVAAFESYISSKTIAHRNARLEEGEFPVIVYHQGLGGTIDENSLLLEYLASNGYIVINSAFQQTDGSGYADGWNTGTGDQRATFDDLNFIIRYVKQHKLSGSKKIFLMGHSYGANSAISFLGEGHKNVDGLIPLDTDFGYVLYNFYQSQYSPFTKDKLPFYNVPIFCIGRREAHFRMIDSFSISKRYYLTIPDMRHNDFTSQGAIGRYYCLPFIKEQQLYRQATENYLSMCSNVLHFLNSYTKSGAGPQKKDIHLSMNWGFEISNPGEKLPFNRPFNELTQKCPTTSQLLDLIHNSGLKETERIYARCNDTSAKKNEMLLNILDALSFAAKVDTVIEYLNWMNEQKVAENNLRDIFLTVSYHTILNSGHGFHFDKASRIYNWMIDKFPTNKYGYMGRLLVSHYTDGSNKELYCKKILEIEPGFANAKAKQYLEQVARNVILNCLKK